MNPGGPTGAKSMAAFPSEASQHDRGLNRAWSATGPDALSHLPLALWPPLLRAAASTLAIAPSEVVAAVCIGGHFAGAPGERALLVAAVERLAAEHGLQAAVEMGELQFVVRLCHAGKELP